MVSTVLKQYGYNRDFLKKHTEVIELKNGNSAIAIVPAWQGRVMTSTAEGDAGFSFGWINHGSDSIREKFFLISMHLEGKRDSGLARKEVSFPFSSEKENLLFMKTGKPRLPRYYTL